MCLILEVNSIPCFNTNLPLLLGGLNCDTYFEKVDVSWSANIAILGGYSCDSNLQAYAPGISRPIYMGLSIPTGNILWQYYIGSALPVSYVTSLISLRLNPSGTNALFSFYDSNSKLNYLHYVSASTGATVSWSSYGHSYSAIASTSLILDDNNFAYVTYIDHISAMEFVKIDLSALVYYYAIEMQYTFSSILGSSFMTTSYVVYTGQVTTSSQGTQGFISAYFTGCCLYYFKLSQYTYPVTSIFYDSYSAQLHVCDQYYSQSLLTNALNVVRRFLSGFQCNGLYGYNQISYVHGTTYLYRINWPMSTYDRFTINLYQSQNLVSSSVYFDGTKIKSYYVSSNQRIYQNDQVTIKYFPYYVGTFNGYNVVTSCQISSTVYTSYTFSPSTLNYLDITSSAELMIYDYNPGIYINTIIASTIAINHISNSWCNRKNPGTVTASTLSNQVYSISDPTLTITITAFTYSQSCTDLIFKYSATKGDLTALPAFIAFNSSALQFSVYSTSITDLGTYTIAVKGTSNDGINATLTFTLTVNPDTICNAATYTIGSYSTQNYNVNNPALIINLIQFTSSVSDTACGAFTYSIQNDNLGTLNVNVFTYNPTSFTVSVQTTSTSNTGAYLVQLTGYQANYPSKTQTVTITVVVADICLTAVVTKATPSGLTYQVTSGSINQVISPFSVSISTCNPISYTATLSNGSILPTFVIFAPSTLTFTYSSSNFADIGSYPINVTGAISSGSYAVATFTVIVDSTYACSNALITSITYSSLTYNTYSSTLNQVISAFTSNVSDTYCGSMQYSVVNDNLPSLDSTLFTFTPSTMTLSIYCTDNNYIGAHVVQIMGWQGSFTSKAITLNINVQVNDGCLSAIMTPSSVPQTTYQVSSDPLNIQVASFALTPTQCAPVTYAAFIDPSTTLPSFIIFNPTTLSLTVSTSDLTTVAIYTIRISGSIYTGVSNYFTFALNVSSDYACQNALYSSTIYADQTYVTYAVAQNLNILQFTSNVSSTYCGAFQYQVYSDSLSSLNSAIYTFSSSTMILTTYCTDVNQIGTHTVQIIGWQGIYSSKAFTININFVIADGCAVATFAVTSLGNQTYQITSGSKAFSITPFVVTPSSCAPIAYSAYLNQTLNLPSFLTFDPVNLVLTCLSSTFSDEGDYLIKIFGSVASGASASFEITLTLSNTYACSNALISSIAYNTQTYSTYALASPLSITPFTSNVSSTYCGDIQYQVYNDGQTILDSQLFTFSLTNMTLTTYCTNQAYIGSHQVSISAWQGVYTTQTYTATITYTILDGCLAATYTFTNPGPYTYQVTSGSFDLSILPFTITPAPCAPITYSAFLNPSSSLPSFATFDPLTPKFTFFSSNLPDVGTYTLLVQGTISQGISASFTFVVTVSADLACSQAIVTSPSYSDTIYYTFDPQITLTFSAFTSNVSSLYCGTFQYTIQSNNTGSLNPLVFLSYSLASLTLTIYSTDNSQVGLHIVQLAGWQGTFSIAQHIESINVYVYDGCVKANLTTSTIANQKYILYTSPLLFQYTDFTVSPLLCGPINYTSFYQDGATLDSSLISFVPSMNKYSISGSDPTKIGLYSIILKAELLKPDLYPSASIQFTLLVNCSISKITYTSIQNQQYLIGKPTLKIPVQPFVQSPNCLFPIYYKATLSNGSPLPPFILFDPIQSNFQVQSNDITLDKQSIQVTLSGTIFDELKHSTSLSFSITFISLIKSTSSSSTKQNSTTSSSSSQSTNSNQQQLQGGGSDNTDNQDDYSQYGDSFSVNSLKKNKLSSQTLQSFKLLNSTISNQVTSFKASISSITNSGLVTIDFKNKIDVPANYQNYSSLILNVEYIQMEASNASLSSWAIAKDKIKVKFLVNSFFKSATGDLYIENGLQIYKYLPTQADQRFNLYIWSKRINRVIRKFNCFKQHGYSVSLVQIIYFFIEYRSASLSQLWGMINALQIMTTLPAFALLFPSNAQFLLSMIITISNFQMIQPQQILGYLKITINIQQSTIQAPASLQALGFDSVDIVTNMGMLFGVVGVVLTFAVIDKLITCIASKFPYNSIIQTIQKKIHNLIYYSLMLRPLIEAYLNACIGVVIAIINLQFTTKIEKAKAIITVVMAFIIFGLPVSVFAFIKLNQSKLATQAFIERFGSLYEGIDINKTNIQLGKYQVPFFLLRRLVLAITIICVKDFVALQLFIQSFISLFYLRFLVEYRPYIESQVNVIEIFNELCISTCFYLSYLFTVYVPEPEKRYQIGWLFMGVIVLNFGINFLGIIFNSITLIHEYCSRKRKIKKMKENQVVPFETTRVNKQILFQQEQFIHSTTLKITQKARATMFNQKPTKDMMDATSEIQNLSIRKESFSIEDTKNNTEMSMINDSQIFQSPKLLRKFNVNKTSVKY